MTLSRLLLSATALALVSACAAERKPPPVAPAPLPRPAPSPAPAPPPPPADWRDAAQTAGTWSYRGDAAGSQAAFGPGGSAVLFSLTCTRSAGQIALTRAGAATASVPLTVTTTSARRSFTAAPAGGEPPGVVVTLPARDPILDAMAFSRGRFMIEVPGLPALYLPAWPEVGRAIEDCR